jgi:hypothetical protein
LVEEGKLMKKKEVASSEPYFYVALVLKGTEKQYLNLLKYLGNRNGSQVIYQCKSLTYFRVTRDSGVKPLAVPVEFSFEAEPQGGVVS